VNSSNCLIDKTLHQLPVTSADYASSTPNHDIADHCYGYLHLALLHPL